MQLGNRGFAISGILYTLFVLFMFILLSVLGSLSSKRSFLQSGISGIEKTFMGDEEISQTDISNYTTGYGRYVYELTDGTNNKIKCVAYLKDNVDLYDMNVVTFTTNDCNNYKNIFTVKPVSATIFKNN